MQSDQAPKIEIVRAPNWELPEIKDVKIRSAQYKPRAPKHFDHPIAAVKDAVEIVVSLAAPMPIRAMSPVLWVGDHQLTESEATDKSGMKIRFWSLDPGKLQSDAPIRMSWINEQPAITQKRAKFVYKPPK